MAELLLGFKELFISVFFEAALAIIWVSLITSAFWRPKEFGGLPAF